MRITVRWVTLVALLVAAAPGERHVAEARVTYRRGGRSGHTQVGRAIVMCP
jgi:hypothetical protein